MMNLQFKSILPFGGEVLHLKSYFSEPEIDQLFVELLEQIPWERQYIKKEGIETPIGRQTAWFSDHKEAYCYGTFQNSPFAITPTLKTLINGLENNFGYVYDGVLANLYKNAQASISWHSDLEKALDSSIPICSLSLGATRVFSFKHKKGKFKGTIDLKLKKGDLLFIDHLSQKNWLHCLRKGSLGDSERINLTFRKVSLN